MVSGVGESAWIFLIRRVGSGKGSEKMAVCVVSFFGSVARMAESGGIKREVDEGSDDLAGGGRPAAAVGAGGIGRPANGRAGKRSRTVSDGVAAPGFGGTAIGTGSCLGSFVSAMGARIS